MLAISCRKPILSVNTNLPPEGKIDAGQCLSVARRIKFTTTIQTQAANIDCLNGNKAFAMMIELIFAIGLPFIKMYRLIFEKQTKKKKKLPVRITRSD